MDATGRLKKNSRAASSNNSKKTEGAAALPTPFCDTSQNRRYENRKVQAAFPHKRRCKNSQQNQSKPGWKALCTAMKWGLVLGWGAVQHLQGNQRDPPNKTGDTEPVTVSQMWERHPPRTHAHTDGQGTVRRP